MSAVPGRETRRARNGLPRAWLEIGLETLFDRALFCCRMSPTSPKDDLVAHHLFIMERTPNGACGTVGSDLRSDCKLDSWVTR